MVSTIEIIIKSFVDKLKWIRKGLSVSQDEASSRVSQSISFYESCLGNREVPLSAEELNELLKKFKKPEEK